MEKKYALLVKGIFLGSMLLGNALPAFALGEMNPLSFQGNGSRIIDTSRPSGTLPVTIAAEDIESHTNTTSSVSYSNDRVEASAETSDYAFNGSISATGYGTAWRSGGSFNDEISFSSIDSGTYTIDLVFNVDAETHLYNTTGRTDLVMALSYWDGRSYKTLDIEYLLSASGNDPDGAVSGASHLLLTGINLTNLEESESEIFLPYTIGLWGSAVNGEISWLNVALADVVVTNDSGTILNPESYTLHSDSLAFNAVSDVPLPGTILLLGLGFAGLAGLRRAKESRLLSRVDSELTDPCHRSYEAKWFSPASMENQKM